MRISPVENLRFPEQGSSSQGKSGPKLRLKSVGDGQQVEIPVLLVVVIREVLTQKDRLSILMDVCLSAKLCKGGKSPLIR